MGSTRLSMRPSPVCDTGTMGTPAIIAQSDIRMTKIVAADDAFHGARQTLHEWRLVNPAAPRRGGARQDALCSTAALDALRAAARALTEEERAPGALPA